MKLIARVCLLIIFCFFLSSTLAFAGRAAKSWVDTYDLSIGPDVRYFSYEEDEVNVEIDGLTYGLAGEFTYHGTSKGHNNVMLNLGLEVLSGNLDYEGETWGGTPTSEDTDDWTVEARGLIGYDLILNRLQIITPFTGLAHRYWNDDIAATGGYEREIRYWYSPIGFKTLSSLSEKWACEITVEYDLFWMGRVKSHLSDVDPAYNDPEVDQEFGDGYGFRVSAGFKKEFVNNCSITIEPYLRHWDINKSTKEALTHNTFDYVYEPENKTTSCGLRLSYGF